MNKQATEQKVITFDATGKNLGRLAVDIANTLRGKNDPSFAPHKIPDMKIIVENTDKLKILQKKREQKMYWRHSNYPGGIKGETLENLMKRDSREVVRRAVYGMLPKNKLQARMMINLKLYTKEAK